MPPSFVHLHLHSEYSLTDSTLRIAPLVQRCAELGLPAVAVTDTSNLFALVKFYKAAEGAGLKPICGADLHIAEDGQAPARRQLPVPGPGRFPEPVPPDLPRLPRGPSRRFRRDPAGLAAGRQRRPDHARRPREPARPGAGRGSPGPGASPGCGNGRQALPDRLYLELTRTQRAGRGSVQRRGAGAGRQRRVAGGRQQRRALPGSRGFRRARGARVHRHRTRARRPEAPARLLAGAVPEVGRGNGGALRRRARGAAEHRRAGQALQPRVVAGHLLPARLPGSRRLHARLVDPGQRAARPGVATGQARDGRRLHARRLRRAPGAPN